ncbi:hypothetical protein A4J56_005328 [Salmonella enterica subsp. diarizonae]|nr:hypothetical protein [Salmonella enterica subsp. diarizonae]
MKAVYHEFIDLTPEEQAEHWREKLHEEALQRAENYTRADYIYRVEVAKATHKLEQSDTRNTLNNLLSRWKKAARRKSE